MGWSTVLCVVIGATSHKQRTKQQLLIIYFLFPVKISPDLPQVRPGETRGDQGRPGEEASPDLPQVRPGEARGGQGR
jgi:hypothetical protein